MEPLAYRMKPTKLEEFVGQEHIIGEDKLLYRLIKADKLTSIILWGPPGCGKTSLARIIANTTNSKFETLNATTAGISDIKQIIEEGKNLFFNPNQKTILFIDEIHRFNKLQQDTLLPYVESGEIILIGATTENPYFEVNKALLSRSTVFKLKALDKKDVLKAIDICLKDSVKGLGGYNINFEESAKEYLANIVSGDLRTAFNTMELAILSTDIDSNGVINITEDVISECIQNKKLSYDKGSDEHYDTISAFIKSMRGSDPDATLFYLAKMLSAGEEPMFIARRIVIAASEEVSIANNEALLVANAAMQAVHQIGMPEARIILAQAAVNVAISPKSNATYLGINKAMEDIKNKYTGEIPMHIRNSPVKEMADYEYGVGYKYPHDYENSYVEQQYLPDEMVGTVYYKPKK